MSDLEKKHIDRLPRKVKVGGSTFTVIRSTAADEADLEGADGVTQFNKMRILLDEGQVFQNLVNTIHHELNHVINWVYGIKDNCAEEDIANQNANGWVALRVDNPALDRWINRAIVLMRKTK